MYVETQDGREYAENKSDTNDHEATAPSHNKSESAYEVPAGELEVAAVLARVATAAFGFPNTPIECSIPMEAYPYLHGAMKDSKDGVYLVLKDGSFQYAYPDTVQVQA